ncbi:MAG: M48 family metallopeptidase [Actinomycetota bacterium]|nr:M48 family metallopeptidase [Actinomycetota bacterium]
MSEIAYSIRRSDRARRVRVLVDPAAGVEVVLPRRARAGDAAAAVRELAPWIERRLHAFAQARAELGATEGEVPYLGEALTLVPEPGRTRVSRRGTELLVPSGEHRPALERWYRRRARVEIAPRLDRACSVAGTSYAGLTIRAQRTRWASCSATGAMSFNWRLLLAPAGVLDSVVWHEVCHLEIADHSPRFWALLEQRFPEYRCHQRWLRRYGALLSL